MATGFNVNQRTPHWFSRHHAHMQRARAMAFAIAGCLLLSACGGFYTAEAIDATVVDAETKEPIARVNVLAEWVIQGGMNYGATVGYLNVMETVTDQNGRFHFPGWGPRANFHFGTVFQEAPALLFFKPGYRYTAVANNGSVLEPSRHRMQSDWNRQAIAMERAKGTADYDFGFIPLVTDLDNLREDDQWSHITKFLCAIGRERTLRDQQHIPTILYSYQSLKDRGTTCTRREDFQ